MNHYPNGDLNINMLPTMDGEEFLRRGYQAAYAECRRRVLAHWHDLQTRYEEFRRYRITWIAPALGVRETRRIVGEYVLTEHDVRGGLSQQKHPDIIASPTTPWTRTAATRTGSASCASPTACPIAA